MAIDLSSMDWIRAALANALVENMPLEDVCIMAEHARTPRDFDAAINALAQTQVAIQ